jgi:VanZ family protein
MIRHMTFFTTHVYDNLAWLKNPFVRYALAFAWTLLVTVMLVQSSSQPVVGPPAPPGAPDLTREIELTIGHIITFFVLVVLWWWALEPRLKGPRALFVAVGFALIFGVITELAQSIVPDREASLFDLAVNWTVTIAAATLISARWRKPPPLPRQ